MWRLRDSSDKGVEQEVARRRILGVNTEFQPVLLRGDKDKSLLFYGSILAKELEKKLKEKKLKVMSQVWVEMLAYAASHCGATSHAQLLSRGGELISFVWLLMVHLGMAGQFQTKAGNRIFRDPNYTCLFILYTHVCGVGRKIYVKFMLC